MNRKRSHPGSAARRRDIIRAALACFSEIGFSRTTMADIRRRAKASTGSIYHQFESKEHLAAEVYLEGIGDHQAGLIAALEGEADARRGIRAMIAHHLGWVRANDDWARFLFQGRHSALTAEAQQALEELNSELMRRAGRWFDAQVEAGRLRRLPADIYVALVAGPYLAHTRLYLSARACTGVNEAIELLADAAWRSLAVRPDGPGTPPRAAAPPGERRSPRNGGKR